MKIIFTLAWSNKSSKLFKSKGASEQFLDYVRRISKFTPCEYRPQPKEFSTSQGVLVWLCDRGKGSQMLSSENLAQSLDRLSHEGCRELWIVIGGPDGFGEEALTFWKPHFRWCFGPMTLPHELAAVVASEQIYRAWTILRGLPYHEGH